MSNPSLRDEQTALNALAELRAYPDLSASARTVYALGRAVRARALLAREVGEFGQTHVAGAVAELDVHGLLEPATARALDRLLTTTRPTALDRSRWMPNVVALARRVSSVPPMRQRA